MNNLYEIVKSCKNGDKENMLYILNKFDPLLNKYSRLLIYDDVKQELILELIKSIYKMPISKEIFKEDKYIISYIKKVIMHKYWAISKQQSQKCSYEYEFDFNLIADTSEEDKLELYDLLKDLTERERNVIISKYIKQMTDAEIGKINNISRQAVNQAKNRAINKLKAYI